MIAVARLANAIGLLGLLPFILGALAVFIWPAHSLQITHYFYIYSAGILAFMAGVYWPIALQLENRCFPLSPLTTMVISQLFFLTAGIGLLLPMHLQIIIYPIAYLALYVVDVRWMKLYWPAWYRQLRLILTGVAILSQAVVAGWLLSVH
ncbi:DUF3429 domain-containing protein [Marinobacter caseinilyticus]|uniref:DUF3429 domain-containing protein n=1 Tax=Marinobacter caseinilyticus TaxID=2692195 RepID=UPI00140C68FA|nr:DUF3429 domain-containing protein [Marinobacter caseinilyticus]